LSIAIKQHCHTSPLKNAMTAHLILKKGLEEKQIIEYTKEELEWLTNIN
jgi:hypothetical protein